MRYLTPLLAVSLTAALSAQGTERIDTDAIAKIRDEGLNRSQVMETLFWLTDAYGPRNRVQEEDMRQMSTVVAVFVWQAANRDEMLPRK